jgi:hypothetical protein
VLTESRNGHRSQEFQPLVLHKLEALIGASGERGISFETIKESNDLGISDRTLQRRLATLVEQGNIEPIGHTRALRYRKLVGLAHTANSPERSVAPSPEPAATDTPLVMFASSELTGGAGFTFEDAVAATYYAALIAQTKSVPGMPDRIVCRGGTATGLEWRATRRLDCRWSRIRFLARSFKPASEARAHR